MTGVSPFIFVFLVACKVMFDDGDTDTRAIEEIYEQGQAAFDKFVKVL